MIQTDKKLHFIVSVLLLLMFIPLFGMITETPLICSIIATFTIGIIKEIYDHYFGSFFSWGDILANTLGIIFGMLLFGLGTII